MMRTDDEEAQDREQEASFWRNYQGRTDCFGTVAKLALLLAIVVQAVWYAVA